MLPRLSASAVRGSEGGMPREKYSYSSVEGPYPRDSVLQIWETRENVGPPLKVKLGGRNQQIAKVDSGQEYHLPSCLPPPFLLSLFLSLFWGDLFLYLKCRVTERQEEPETFWPLVQWPQWPELSWSEGVAWSTLHCFSREDVKGRATPHKPVPRWVLASQGVV